MASGLIKIVEGIVIKDKYAILGQVKHSQWMNDPLVQCLFIGEKTGIVTGRVKDQRRRSSRSAKTPCHNLKFTSKAASHGCEHEAGAINAYESSMVKKHNNFKVTKCGLLLNADVPFLHATCDFCFYCNCFGLGCGELKCAYCLEGFDFGNYVTKKVSCLEKDNIGTYVLKRLHACYYRVQQQLFTTKRSYNDLIECCFEHDSAQFVYERIYPDEVNWNEQVPKLSIFWRTCILPEILGRWSILQDNIVRVTNALSITVDELLKCRDSKTSPDCKVTIGQTEKYARSSEVTERDFALINAKDGCMNDVIIHQDLVLLKKKNPMIEAFQRPTLGPETVTGFGVPCKVTVASVQQQQNGFDCGIFAAFAKCLALGQDPMSVEFNIP
eukprot:gene1230-1353_t